MPAAGNAAGSWTPAYDGGGQVRDGAWVAGHHRDAGPVLLAGRDAGHRPQGTAASRGTCGSPTSTGTGSPPSPPTRARASSRTWSCGTVAASPNAGLGRPDHRCRHPLAGPPVRLTTQSRHCGDQGRSRPGPVGLRLPARQPGSQPRSASEITTSRITQATTSGVRKFEVSGRGTCSRPQVQLVPLRLCARPRSTLSFPVFRTP
jgi:hypothetical protein